MKYRGKFHRSLLGCASDGVERFSKFAIMVKEADIRCGDVGKTILNAKNDFKLLS
jgi:hypothetical protein